MRSALVLNATYEPLSVVPARRAVCLVLADKADVIEDDGTVLHSERSNCRARSVVRLRYVVKVPYAPSHRHVASSDLRPRRLPLPVLRRLRRLDRPRDAAVARGPAHVWENVAAACRPCNLRKRDRTPDEAGMRLARMPHAPREQAWVTCRGHPRARRVEAVPGRAS
jgi:5-methylcytosine-specific restriction endonuclease McrA